MRLPELLGAAALGSIVATAAFAQASPNWGAHPLLPVIAEAESQGRNIPNFRYDKTHTAGGGWQITDTNWRAYAPQLDIDIGKYPNAMSAPEWLQGQVAGLMVAREGVLPWTCCNAKLRERFGSGTPPPRTGRMPPQAKAVETKTNEVPKPPHCWDVFAKECGPRKWDVFAKN